MKLALNSSTIRTTPLLDKIRVAGQAGYEGIELWAVDLYEHVGRGGEVSEVEAALSDHGLTVPCLIAVRGWGDTQGREYDLALDEARRRMELAARIGAPFVVCTPPLERPGFQGLEQSYGDLLEIGRAAGVRALLEYISFFPSLNALPDAVTVLDRCADPEGALVIDAFHSWNQGATPDDLRALPLERIAHYHLDDAHPEKPAFTQVDGDRVMPGDGQINLAGEMAVLREKGYEGWISLELFNEELWAQDPLEVAKRGLERMRALLDDPSVTA